MKYVLVTGGVISGIGKGVIASCLGTILKHRGLRVTSIKIDPYINIDAGTFSPYEHGEVYVLDDGGEVDLDLGNYERFLDITLHSANNITTGKIYDAVIKKERRGDYLGKTVQVVPHITDKIQEWVESVSVCPVDGNNQSPEVCIIELGGTIGDIEGMPFVEAFRQFHFKVGRQNMCVVHVSLVPQPSSTGEHKTKPTQASVRELRSLGLSPDFVVCRSEKPIGSTVKTKISEFCHISPEQVICLHDATSIYSIPIMLEKQNISTLLNERLDLKLPEKQSNDFMKKWRTLAFKQENLRTKVTIALVGKYTSLMDAYASVMKALLHASLECNRKLDLRLVDAEDLEEIAKETKPFNYFKAWQEVCDSHGVIVPGGFGSRGVEGKIAVCKWARTKNIPFLGVCLGMQLAIVEFARNVLHWSDAHSQEMNPDGNKLVVIEMPEHNPGDMGGTMRLGRRRTNLTKSSYDSIIRKLYNNVDYVEERHRHRYEVNPEFIDDFEKKGIHFVGKDVDSVRMEILELENHQYFVGCQYHPEYLSRPLKPSPPYLGLILAATKKLDSYIAQGGNLASGESSETSDDEESLLKLQDYVEIF